MTEEEIKKAAQENIEKIAKDAAKVVAEGAVLDTVVAEVKKAFEGKEYVSKEDAQKQVEEAVKKAIEDAKIEMQNSIDKVSAQVKKASQIVKQDVKGSGDTVKALVHAISEGLGETDQAQKSYAGGATVSLTTKALSPADFGSTADYADLNNDRSLPVDRNPYAPVYLRNIFPNISTQKENLTIWKKKANQGKAAIWKRGTGSGGADVDKPQVKPTWAKEVVSVDWIAGTTDIPREMLDDIDFIKTEVPYTLVYSEDGVLAAENEMILTYIRANNVDFSRDADFDIGLEKIIAAAFGQIGSKYMTPTHILINNWDYLTYLAFNKAGGSGEYNLPGLTVSFINGQMYINNLIAVPVPELNSREAYVIASSRSRFVNRMEVELKVSDQHKDNFTKNMLTYRAENRVTFYTYDDNSIIKVTLPEKPAEEVEPPVGD